WSRDPLGGDEERTTKPRSAVLHGSINHVSITVRDLPKAMEFFAPLLTLLGYTVGSIGHDPRSKHDLTVNINEANGTAFNIWEAEPALAGHPFEVYEPGLPHVAFNVERHEQVDQVHRLVRDLGGSPRWSRRVPVGAGGLLDRKS